MITVKQVLVKARNLIEKQGLCKNKLNDAQGRHCMIGAVSSVLDKAKLDDGYAYRELRLSALDRLQDALPKGNIIVYRYNDQPGTRKKQVINVFNRAIKSLDKEK